LDNSFVTAIAGSTGSPAAIGGGGIGDAGSITIMASTVVAQAGSGGAISGGANNSKGSIGINGGTIIGTGKGIGKGENGSIPTTINGNPVIFATDINGKSSDPGNGIATGSHVTINTGGKTITLKTEFTIPAGSTLTVPPGWTLDHTGVTLNKTGNLVLSEGAITKP
jgi:hypothetical protein